MKLACICILLSIAIQLGLTQQPEGKDWWKSSQFFMPYKSETAKELPLISVFGKRFVNANSDTILFHGLASTSI